MKARFAIIIGLVTGITQACGGSPTAPSTSPPPTLALTLKGPTSPPTLVLSPLVGPLRVTVRMPPQNIPDGVWEFRQHMLGLHLPNAGIGGSTDLFAWDCDLAVPGNLNADAGQTVYATAAGEVVLYAGQQAPGGGFGAVLLAHPDGFAPVWWSGYLHMTLPIQVQLGQRVGANTIIGNIGKTGAGQEHLHFVVYKGENRVGGLQSYDATFIERLPRATADAFFTTALRPFQ